ncbi:hypothetical protein D3C84_864920 [compost metagenome]|jgi:hypothetical protein
MSTDRFRSWSIWTCRYRKHFFALNGLGFRDLCTSGDDLLILAGPTMDLDGR